MANYEIVRNIGSATDAMVSNTADSLLIAATIVLAAKRVFSGRTTEEPTGIRGALAMRRTNVHWRRGELLGKRSLARQNVENHVGYAQIRYGNR